MKKLLIFILVLLISLSFVNAIGFSTIMTLGGKLGIQFPQETETFICAGKLAVGDVTCVTDQIKGQFAQFNPVSKLKEEVYAKAWNAIPKVAQEAYKTYNEFNSYLSQVKGIINELKVDEKGNVNSGCIEVGEGSSKRTTCFKGEIKPTFNENTKEMTYTINKAGSEISINKVTYANIKPAEKGTQAYLKTDKDGNVIEADLTANEKGGIYNFNGQVVELLPNTRVKYENGQLTIYGKSEGTGFKFSQEGSTKAPSNYEITGTGNMVCSQDGCTVNGNLKVYDRDLMYTVQNNEKDSLFITDDAIKAKGKINWIAANKNKLEYNTDSTLQLFPGNSWMTNVKQGDTMTLQLKGVGNIQNNELDITSGQVVSITSSTSRKCDSTTTYNTKDVKLNQGTKISCIAMVAKSEGYLYTINKDGSTNTEVCEQTPSITSDSIFDVATGRVISWITGRLSIGQVTYVCTQAVTQELNKKNVRCIDTKNPTYNGACKICSNCNSVVGVMVSETTLCYDPISLDKIKTQQPYPDVIKQIDNCKLALKDSRFSKDVETAENEHLKLYSTQQNVIGEQQKKFADIVNELKQPKDITKEPYISKVRNANNFLTPSTKILDPESKLTNFINSNKLTKIQPTNYKLGCDGLNDFCFTLNAIDEGGKSVRCNIQLQRDKYFSLKFNVHTITGCDWEGVQIDGVCPYKLDGKCQ